MNFLRVLWDFLLRVFGLRTLPASTEAEAGGTSVEAPTAPLTLDAPAVREDNRRVDKPDIVLTKAYSDAFFLNGVRMASRLGSARFDEYLAVWDNESGIHANPNPGVANPPAVGLIQWTTHPWSPPDGHSTPDEFRQNYDVTDQLVYAEHYYAPHAPYESRGDIYGVTYLPARVAARGRSPGTVLATAEEDPGLYNPNKTLDVNGDGAITIQDLIDVATRTTARDPRWPEFVARTRWAEQELGIAGPGLLTVGTVVAIVGIVGVAAYAYVKA